MPPTLPGPGSRRDQALSCNMRLIAHHELQGFGGIGEGMAMQLARDGRRILWLAHESAPKNFTGVDVTDPRAPRVVVQTELPHAKVRSNSLDIVGDVMAVAYQTQTTGLTPAGFDLFDISVPEKPRLISHFDYIDGGAMILDFADKAHPKLVSRWQYSPPFNGFTHTVLPLFDRNLLIVSDECIKDDGFDWPKLVWVVDARVEENLVPIITLPAPPHGAFAHRGGRFGAHNLHE